MKTNRKQKDLQIESLEPMVLMSASAADLDCDDSANAMVGQAAESVVGTDGDDLMVGIRDNQIFGEDGDDLIITGDGFNNVDGGEGEDTLRFGEFERSELSIVQNDDGSLTISDGNSTNVVTDIENFQFLDQTVSMEAIQSSINNAPVIETSSHLSIAENQTEVATIVATDADGETLTFSLSDAQDGASFVIDPDTGVLSFREAPDFENPNSLNGTNVYDVTVRVTDGNTTTLQTFWVTVTDVDETGGGNNVPTFDNLAENEVIEVNEGTVNVRDLNATDLDGDTITFSFSDGINTPGDGPNQDPGLFNLDPNTGELTFRVAPDFENPADADGDNEYQVTVVISDGQSAVERDITIRVLDVDEGGSNNAPTFTNVEEGGIVTVPENTTFVGDANGTDPDGDDVTFSIAGGTDAALFQVDAATGVVTFINAPDYENPLDSDGDNDYNIVLRISDGTLVEDRNVVVRVTDVTEGGSNNAPSFTNVAEGQNVTVPENTTFVGDANGVDPDGDDVTFSIVGGDDSGLFSIDASTGVVTFITAPDFEAPTDADGNNVYSLTLRISDGTLFQDRNVTVTVTDTNEGGTNNAPSFSNVSEGEIVTVPENTTLVGDANGSDPDGDSVTFSIAGGADAALFQVDAATG
ncbi:MAG: cadherin domain-containing protein, partial [Fuerstiella sp.]